ncbi:hypothetical protein [Haladaptatus sp. AB643]|uniref:DUF7344 domain-containing protein n=1 Tax=unclassified Haladaptatus TaxID=2622732 RepID=UPI00209C00ED|nr:hypothetical protein [Haladaptatus sp. AB643]MCO8255802.1 hypothetical protein [Haladaptatus sp. AB618]
MLELIAIMSAPPNTADSVGDTTTTSQDTAASQPLSKDTIFHILQVERRRLILQYLQERTDTVSLRDLAEQVAAWENELSVVELTSKERQRAYISLYQTHLPTLDTEGIIEYDKDRGTIKRTSRADQFDSYLFDTVPQDPSESSTGSAVNRRWERYYLGGTLFSTSLLGAKLLQLPLVSQVASRFIIPIILFVFSILTAGHYYTRSVLPESISIEKVTQLFSLRGRSN